ASHALGPDTAHEALARADASVAALFEAAGGADAFLERYAVVLCADHGQTLVEHAARLDVSGARITASNRAAMLYGDDPRALAEALDGDSSVGVAVFLENGEVVARRAGDEDLALLDQHPQGRVRAAAALRNPNAGEVIVSAAPGYEFVDLAGHHHVGGGSHGSLAASDSEVPMLTVGLGAPPDSITGIKALLLAHFGVARNARAA
ncbi:MAG: alkaline phosphatase family protein, partial [Actinobacteria bacterium]|nr:alkaline phosphatase family protein [Actinomycetota bacterium]